MRISSIKNPAFNKAINPAYNRTINPAYNRTINPAYNRTINPAYNRTINPAYNRMINPAYNRTINPAYNRTINPAYNRTINPAYNRMINPNFNPNFSGAILFALDGFAVNFTVACEEVLIFFDDEGRIQKMAVKHESDGYVLFDSELKLIGHLETNSQSGFNHFDMANTWLGFLVT